MKLDLSFYTREDVVQISRELLGKTLCANINGNFTEAIIVETEAYAGINDKASHAYGGRRTKRTEIMFYEGGHAYIYLCYGMYSLFNVVTNIENIPHAVLIRGAVALNGIKTMLERTDRKKLTDDLLTGPGKLSKAMGLHFSLTGISLLGNTVWLEDKDIIVSSENIIATPRIGVDYAAEDALLPYRFVAKQDFTVFRD
ncbi:MAG: DNA-3-methyladenine glycosylase [Prevotellaceae bacterium]|jgi:DNA-3-methyladenine glycosylase|nr:DNA-3-methyladenine glycosylase [Prevotellaceae bacterium]